MISYIHTVAHKHVFHFGKTKCQKRSEKMFTIDLMLHATQYLLGKWKRYSVAVVVELDTPVENQQKP